MADAIKISEQDNVAVCLRSFKKNSRVSYYDQRELKSLVLADDVDFGHKFACRAIAKHANVIKYGSVIGEATGDIAEGAHVHIHNVKSKRCE